MMAVHSSNTWVHHKTQTCAKIPLIVAKRNILLDMAREWEPILCDEVPSVLALMGLDKPAEMTGQSLFYTK